MISQRILKRLTPVLGTISDQQAAAKFGLTRDQVYAVRTRLGIEASRSRIDWRAIDPLIGTMSDAALGRHLGLKDTAIRERRRKLLAMGVVLNKPEPQAPAPTKEVVKKMGKKTPVVGRPQTEWSKHHLALLGTMGDTQLADLMGLTRMTVWRKRQSLGL